MGENSNQYRKICPDCKGKMYDHDLWCFNYSCDWIKCPRCGRTEAPNGRYRPGKVTIATGQEEN